MSKKTCSDLIQFIHEIINSMETIPTAISFPTLGELKSSQEKFYNEFSNATYKYNMICDALSKLQFAKAMIVKLSNELNNNVSTKESYSQKALYLKELQSLNSECVSLVACYETQKASSEAIVKFYNSCQYIINSNHFEDTHAYH